MKTFLVFIGGVATGLAIPFLWGALAGRHGRPAGLPNGIPKYSKVIKRKNGTVDFYEMKDGVEVLVTTMTSGINNVPVLKTIDNGDGTFTDFYKGGNTLTYIIEK